MAMLGHLAGVSAVFVVGEALTKRNVETSKTLVFLLFLYAAVGAVYGPAADLLTHLWGVM